MNTIIDGQLEINHENGVIWFNTKFGQCILRICRLPKPIPDLTAESQPAVEIRGEIIHPVFYNETLDVTHMYGVSWRENK